MADKTKSFQTFLLRSFIFLTFISFENCINNSLDECICDNSDDHCYEWVNRMTCALMGGKFKSELKCNCCQSCLIQREFMESCYESIPGFKIQCTEGLLCSKKYGFICIDLTTKQLEETIVTIEWKKNPYEDKLLLLVPEHKRPLKRVPRMQYKGRHKNYAEDEYISFEKKPKYMKIIENS